MLESLLDPHHADLGHGLMVQRMLPNKARRMVGPFVFLDHAGPVVFPQGPTHQFDVRPHPHIGLSTVSYLFTGAVTHRDSLGYEQVIVPGEVNWMTAGRGISHSERFEDPSVSREGLELLQAWVALPKSEEEIAPAFDNYSAQVLPEAREAGVWMRLIAGDAFGLHSPVKTHSPLFYVHAVLDAGALLRLPSGHPERAAYVAAGRLELDGREYVRGQMLVFSQDSDPVLRALEPAVVMLLGGEPLGERFVWWNFVSSSRDRIEQAKHDWQAGRFALPPHDHDEFIPLPEKQIIKPPSPPMS